MLMKLKLTNDGFPILPTPWNGSEFKKKELCYLLLQNIATYLFTELANNGWHHQIPFKAIAEQTLSFISPEYLPAWFKFLNPWNMHKSTIQDFFNHILQHQLEQGPERAF
jgi:hypothetical protein